MDQSSHAFLAVEAFRKVQDYSKTAEGKQFKIENFVTLLGQNLKDVVVAAWLPDLLIKDMQYGHIFKNASYRGNQRERFVLGKKELIAHLPKDVVLPKITFDAIPDAWWDKAYRVKENGGHLPARVNALCQTTRDMLRMGDDNVTALMAKKHKGSEIIAKNLLYSSQDIALMLWMVSHYIADAHMPFHCDNRGLASTVHQKTHSAIEKLWGKHVPKIFKSQTILKESSKEILAAEFPKDSALEGIDYGTTISPLKNNGDPWKEAVYICRASFAVSYALVPPSVAKVDDETTDVPLDAILGEGFCGEDRFWEISRAIMTDSVNAIARFWVDIWKDAVKV